MTEKETLERRKQTVYSLICDEQYRPMKIKELAILLDIPKENRPDLKEVLDALTEENRIEKTAKGKYQKATERLVKGRFLAHPRGFGFVEAEGREQDIFIPEDQVGDALHQDLVQVALLPQPAGRRQEGAVKRVLEHAVKEVVGTFHVSRGRSFVLPDSQRIHAEILIEKGQALGAVEGHKVVAEITSYGRERKLKGRILEILGHRSDPGADILSLVRQYGIPDQFPEKVLRQAEEAPETVRQADRTGRLDLRETLMVTIDGEDAKDLDDAVSLSFDGEHYHLGVHIADVAHYVSEGSALDREAGERGTSVYLADRVIPMLPRRLSNGICSLNAGIDRLALSCLMEIDGKGNILSHELAESVIRVDRRMSYTEVNALLSGENPAGEQYVSCARAAVDGTAPGSGKEAAAGNDADAADAGIQAAGSAGAEEEYGALLPMLLRMGELSGILREKRRQRGSIDFDFPESKVLLDEKGVPVEIKAYETNAATRLIEDFMLAANETIAEHFYWQETPFLYRTHDAPDPEKIRQLATFLNHYGYGLKGVSGEIHPKELQKLLARIEDTPEEAILSRVTLRSMRQAVYSVEGKGHFGLAARHYCHFTSPIRRYPDLQIHRIIKESLCGGLDSERRSHYADLLPSVAEHCSRTERRAEEAERETVKLKKAEYMEQHLGEECEAVISGITSFGMYAELPNTVEGLIHVSRMYDDRYYYKEETFEMQGIDTGRTFHLGDRVRIRVVGADKAARTVDFELSE